MPPKSGQPKNRNKGRNAGGSVNKPLMQYGDQSASQGGSCCSCNRSMVKTFFIFFTAIILLVALGLIGLGSYLIAVRIQTIPVLMGEVAYVTHFLLFVVGFLLLIACIIGFTGTAKEEPCLLLTYCCMLTIILVVQLGTGILALCFSELFRNWLADRMKHTMQHQYAAGSPEVDSAVDIVHQSFKCCGSYNFRDWHDSVFQKTATTNREIDTLNYNLSVPDSCCLRVQDSCGFLPHPSNVYQKGCIVAIFDHLRERYYTICLVVLTFMAVELIGVILACCYARILQQNVRKIK